MSRIFCKSFHKIQTDQTRKLINRQTAQMSWPLNNKILQEHKSLEVVSVSGNYTRVNERQGQVWQKLNCS